MQQCPSDELILTGILKGPPQHNESKTEGAEARRRQGTRREPIIIDLGPYSTAKDGGSAKRLLGTIVVDRRGTPLTAM
jgi:hypothetical protein